MITNELAKTAGVNSKAIRYYSRIGLLHPIRNPDNGYREYTTDDAARARFIRKAHWLGLTLKDVQTLLDEADSGKSACERARSIVINRILENQQLLIHVQMIQKRMEAALASWASIPNGPLHQEHVSGLIDSLECDQEELSLHEDYQFVECENYDNVAAWIEGLWTSGIALLPEVYRPVDLEKKQFHFGQPGAWPSMWYRNICGNGQSAPSGCDGFDATQDNVDGWLSFFFKEAGLLTLVCWGMLKQCWERWS